MLAHIIVLFISAMFAGFVLRSLRIPLDWYIYKWRPLLYIAGAFKWLSFISAVFFLPALVSGLMETYLLSDPLPQKAFFKLLLHLLVIIGFMLGILPGREFYKYLVGRQRTRQTIRLMTPSRSY